MKSRSYQDLVVWRKCIHLVKDVYILLRQFPKEERYALCDQMRRAAVSVPSNIAEGQARQYAKEFQQFLYIAKGSLAELHTHLLISKELGYMPHSQLTSFEIKITEISKMLNSLLSKLGRG